MPFMKERHKISRSRYLENLSKRQGLRHAIFNTVGDRYIGEWKDGVKTGKGSIRTRYQQIYEGDLYLGYRHGFGVLAHQLANTAFGLEYRGDWRWGKCHGFGLRRYPDGGVYLGWWVNGNRHGYGWMWFANGDFYAGDWAKDNRGGLGMLVEPNVNRYEGNWLNDLKHGRGRFLHLDSGQMQEGIWDKGVCTFSTLKDIYYRQAALYSTQYPIGQVELLDFAEVCTAQEMRALQGLMCSLVLLIEPGGEDQITKSTSTSSEMNVLIK